MKNKLFEEKGPCQYEPWCDQAAESIEDGTVQGDLYYGYSYGPILINGEDASTFFKSDDVKSLILRDISYPVKDGHPYYNGLDEIVGTYSGLDFSDADVQADLIKLGFDEDGIKSLANHKGDEDEEIETWIDYDIQIDDSEAISDEDDDEYDYEDDNDMVDEYEKDEVEESFPFEKNPICKDKHVGGDDPTDDGAEGEGVGESFKDYLPRTGFIRDDDDDKSSTKMGAFFGQGTDEQFKKAKIIAKVKFAHGDRMGRVSSEDLKHFDEYKKEYDELFGEDLDEAFGDKVHDFGVKAKQKLGIGLSGNELDEYINEYFVYVFMIANNQTDADNPSFKRIVDALVRTDSKMKNVHEIVMDILNSDYYMKGFPADVLENMLQRRLVRLGIDSSIIEKAYDTFMSEEKYQMAESYQLNENTGNFMMFDNSPNLAFTDEEIESENLYDELKSVVSLPSYAREQNRNYPAFLVDSMCDEDFCCLVGRQGYYEGFNIGIVRNTNFEEWAYNNYDEVDGEYYEYGSEKAISKEELKKIFDEKVEAEAKKGVEQLKELHKLWGGMFINQAWRASNGETGYEEDKTLNEAEDPTENKDESKEPQKEQTNDQPNEGHKTSESPINDTETKFEDIEVRNNAWEELDLTGIMKLIDAGDDQSALPGNTAEETNVSLRTSTAKSTTAELKPSENKEQPKSKEPELDKTDQKDRIDGAEKTKAEIHEGFEFKFIKEAEGDDVISFEITNGDGFPCVVEVSNKSSGQFTADELKKVIERENPSIWFNDAEAKYWFMDFSFEKGGKTYWISSDYIAGDMSKYELSIYDGNDYGNDDDDKKLNEAQITGQDSPSGIDFLKTLDEKGRYMFLSRMQQDCGYFLDGHEYNKFLWAGNVEDQIKYMKWLYNSFPKNKKPEWISMEEIEDYEKRMAGKGKEDHSRDEINEEKEFPGLGLYKEFNDMPASFWKHEFETASKSKRFDREWVEYCRHKYEEAVKKEKSGKLDEEQMLDEGKARLDTLHKLMDKCWYNSKDGKGARLGNWEIALGGYDRGYEFYYNNMPLFAINKWNEIDFYQDSENTKKYCGFTNKEIFDSLKSYRDLNDLKTSEELDESADNDKQVIIYGGDIEFYAPKSLVMAFAHSGDNMEDAKALLPYVKKELSEYSDEQLKKLLREYGIEDADSKSREELELYTIWLCAWNFIDSDDPEDDNQLDESINTEIETGSTVLLKDGRKVEIIGRAYGSGGIQCGYKVFDEDTNTDGNPEEIMFDDIKRVIQEPINESFDVSKNIYNPSLILQAYDIEHNWYESEGKGDDDQLPEIMVFVIDGDDIVDTKRINRNEIGSYKGNDNEYVLFRNRDSGLVLTDYDLMSIDNFVKYWNNDYSGNVDESARLKELASKMVLREADESSVAKVKINSIQFDGKEGPQNDKNWQEGKTYSFEEFQKLVYEYDYAFWNNPQHGGYDKLWYTANITLDYNGKKEDTTYQGRLDLGDGKYGKDMVSVAYYMENQISSDLGGVDVKILNPEVPYDQEAFAKKYGTIDSNIDSFIANDKTEIPEFPSSEKPAEEIAVGDIFYNGDTSGYDKRFYNFYRVVRKTKASCWVEKLKSKSVEKPIKTRKGELDYQKYYFPSDEVDNADSIRYGMIDVNKPLRIGGYGQYVSLSQGRNTLYQWSGKALEESVEAKGNKLMEKFEELPEDDESTQPAMFKEGDILFSSWGYSMRLVDFYKVIGASKSFVKLAHLADYNSKQDEWGQAGYKMPKLDQIEPDSNVDGRRFKVHVRDDGKPFVKINNYEWAEMWDGKPKAFDTYD